jgi:hypothetical protein
MDSRPALTAADSRRRLRGWGERGLELANVGFLKSPFDSRIGIWNIEPGFQEMPD